MKKVEIQNIELYLEDLGFTKYKVAKTADGTDYEYMKSFKNEEDELLYIISFRHWNFSKYNPEMEDDMDIDIYYPFNGRLDFTTKLFNIDDAISFAEKTYEYLKNSYVNTNN